MSQVVVMYNGRRQTIKVTPNTTILEIIDAACQKNGLASEDYDLRHHRSILDSTSTVRFSALPQNAQLELVEVKQRRVESTVTLCLQLESGQRLQGECQPNSMLWEFVEKVAPEMAATMVNPVIVYMRREIIGKDVLAKTSLRTIGLTGGRAVVRLVDKTLEELRFQANVSAPLIRQPPMVPEKTSDSNILKVEEKLQDALPSDLKKNIAAHLPLNEVNGDTTTKTQEPLLENLKPSSILDTPMQVDAKTPEVFESTAQPESKNDAESSGCPSDHVGVKRARTKSPEAGFGCNVEKVILLGERNAVAYNLDTAPPAAMEDLPDDFYELTLADVRSLAAAARRVVKELEEAPMLTSEQRKLDNDGLVLQKLSQYKACVVRVRFPDRTVLQGCFKPIETVETVYEFVRGYLQNPSLNFYLYTTPPKYVLKTEIRLVEADCVPSAVLYLGVHAHDQERPASFLKNDVLDKFSSLAAATQAANQLREKEKKTLPSSQKSETSIRPSTSGLQLSNPTQSTSTNSTGYVRPATQPTANTTASNLPKWFKLAK